MLRRSIILAATALSLAHAEGPSLRSAETGLLGAFALPTSGFAGKEPGEGHARPGLGAGLDALVHLHPYFASASGLYFLWNSLDSDEDLPSGNPPAWVNLPLLTGVRLQTSELGNIARLFGQAQIGVNFASITDEVGPGGTVEVGWTTSLALSAGIGAILLDRIHVGARYFHLGKPEYSLAGGGGTLGTQKPRVIAFMIGAYFNTDN